MNKKIINTLLVLCALAAQQQLHAQSVRRAEHTVNVTSTAPGIAGEMASLYVREVSAVEVQGLPVLFVHGAGTPAEVAFDVPLQGHSWMSYLAQRGFATYSVDMTGYGRSTRPPQMEDRCNLSDEQQQQEFGDTCKASHAEAITTMASDWNDIDAVVDMLRQKHGVEKVHLVGWSQGGPRTAGYASVHPEKVGNVVVLAPAYNRMAAATAADAPIAGPPVTKQSKKDFLTQWTGQAPCTNQMNPVVADSVWGEMIASDPVGATWGILGVRRAPRVPTFGWTQTEVAATQTPILMVTGLTDGQVNPERVREFYADLGAKQKVIVEMPCSSHNAMWEHDAEQLFDATWQWLSTTTFQGKDNGSFVLETTLTRE